MKFSGVCIVSEYTKVKSHRLSRPRLALSLFNPSFGLGTESSQAFSISSFRSYASSLSLFSDLVKGVHACEPRAAKPRFTPSVARGYFRVSHVSADVSLDERH